MQKNRKKRSYKRAIITSLVAIAIIIIILVIVFKDASNQPIPVTLTKVSRRTIIQTVSATGKIQPETKVAISPETSGEIIYLGVKEGDTVTSKTLLARINPDIIETQLEQYKSMVDAAKQDIESAKAQVINYTNNLSRTKELYEKKFASKQELDLIQSQYDAAVAANSAAVARYESSKASLKQIEKTAQRTTVYSPLDGIVTSLNVEKGERVVGTNMMAGTAMMTISDLSVMNAEVSVDENDIVLVKIGDTASIEIDAISGKIYKGVVVEVGHSALSSSTVSQDQTTNFSVKIRILDKEARLRPGMSCNVDIHTDVRHDVLSVPLQSVTTREKSLESTAPEMQVGIEKIEKKSDTLGINTPKVSVFVKNGNIVNLIDVEIGISDRGFIEIISGLKEGEEVVSGSYQAISRLLQDSSYIKIENLPKHKTN